MIMFMIIVVMDSEMSIHHSIKIKIDFINSSFKRPKQSYYYYNNYS